MTSEAEAIREAADAIARDLSDDNARARHAPALDVLRTYADELDRIASGSIRIDKQDGEWPLPPRFTVIGGKMETVSKEAIRRWLDALAKGGQGT